MKDILSIKSLQDDVLNPAHEIVKFCRQSSAKAFLKVLVITNKMKPRAILNTVDTRWQSARASLHSILHSKSLLLMAVVHSKLKDKVPVNVKNTIQDDEVFWTKLKIVHDLIEPISILIKNVKGDRPNLSYFTMKITRLFSFLNNSFFFLNSVEEANIKDKLEDREVFLYHPVQLAAHYLNPRLRSRGLTEESEE